MGNTVTHIANTSEFTFLQLAADSNQVEICTKLMEILDQKNPKNNEGVSPLQIAAQKGHWDLAQTTIEIIGKLVRKNPRRGSNTRSSLCGTTPEGGQTHDLACAERPPKEVKHTI